MLDQKVRLIISYLRCTNNDNTVITLQQTTLKLSRASQIDHHSIAYSLIYKQKMQHLWMTQCALSKKTIVNEWQHELRSQAMTPAFIHILITPALSHPQFSCVNHIRWLLWHKHTDRTKSDHQYTDNDVSKHQGHMSQTWPATVWDCPLRKDQIWLLHKKSLSLRLTPVHEAATSLHPI